ncbi:MAG: PorV/PorQ family protein [Calditrichaeota bacterium]|nr:PorV/PorQ family protein [Calditrichota bacterium]
MFNSKYTRKQFLFFLIYLFLSSQIGFAQIRAGASFLKMGMGVRISSMGLTSAGEIRDNYAIFTNPGAAGFLREWHWSATYNKWIADVYHASFLFNKRIRMPWSNQTRFSVGAIYQGVPEFDSSDNATPTASANDLLFAVTMGQPLTFISNNIAIGTNVKYLKSKLDNFSASSLIFDIGLLARTRRFDLKNSFLKHGIFTAGISLTQLGQDLKFDKIDTPLPQTMRAGIAFYAGSHSGIQLQICGDYFSIKDETGHFALGGAINFTNLFSVNFGYNFNNDLMDKFSIGGTFQLDDFSAPAHSFFPGRNKAARLELATLNEGEFFSRSYQGGAHFLPNCPEAFEWKNPSMDDTIKTETVNFNWEKTRDPDIFDSVSYILLVSPSRDHLSDLLALPSVSQDDFLNRVRQNDSLLLVCEDNLSPSNYRIPTPAAGHYYWSVIAVDENSHTRAAKKNGEKIGHFLVPATDIQIQDIKFKYSPWITQDDYHGTLEIILANNGNLAAKNFELVCRDSVISLRHTLPSDSSTSSYRVILSKTIDNLPAKSTKTITIPWHTPLLGKHTIFACVDKPNTLQEKNTANNYLKRSFSTIPKGFVAFPDTINSLNECLTRLTMPLITRIFFDANSAEVHDEYLFANGSDPYLAILAQRLMEHPEMTISLQGIADPNSEKATKRLTNLRAKAVKDSLIRIGVNGNQVNLLGGNVLSKRRVPANPADARMVFEDRRYVEIFTAEKNQAILFAPINHEFVEYSTEPIPVEVSVKTAVPSMDSKIRLTAENFADSSQINSNGDGFSLQEKSNWLLADSTVRELVNKKADYEFVLIDNEGRRFRTHAKNTQFTKASLEQHHRIVMPLKFAKTEPIYSFYWDLCFKEVEKLIGTGDWRFRFSGHGCAIGSDAVNLRLSRQRVKNFDQKFRHFLDQKHPQSKATFLKRLDKPKGYGEKKPLTFKYASGETRLFGDNEKPSGRILNRRIELELYRTH